MMLRQSFADRAVTLLHRSTFRHPADALAALLFLGLAALVLLTFRDYGISFDEDVQDQYGRYILDWYTTWGGARDALDFIDLQFYGGLFDTIAAAANLVSPLGRFETRHLLNAVVGLIGIAGCWRLGRHLGGPTAGLAAAALLALMPSWYGMMFINPKDIPFAAGMVWALYFLTRIAESQPDVPRRVVAGFGIAVGVMMATRVGGMLAIGYLGLVLLLPVAALARQPKEAFGLGLHLLVRVLVPVVLIAWSVMLPFWPYAQVDPLGHPFEAYRHFSTLAPDIDTLFMGEQVSAENRPLLYLPVYLLIKLPDVAVALLALAAVFGAAYSLRRGVPARIVPLLLGVLFPVVFVLITRPELYDAERHFLFLLPGIAVACGLGLVAAWRATPKVLQPLAAAAAGFAALLGTTEMTALHPYEYAYYNRLVGGIEGAQDRFETEYWGTSLTEATRALSDMRDGDSAPLAIAVCGNEVSAIGALPQGMKIVQAWHEADFFIATTRHHCENEMVGTEVMRVEREGVPFAVVKDLRPVLARRPVSNGAKRS